MGFGIRHGLAILFKEGPVSLSDRRKAVRAAFLEKRTPEFTGK